MTTTLATRAQRILADWKGENYRFGVDCLDDLGALTARFGRRALVIAGGVGKAWGAPLHDAVRASLAGAGVTLCGELAPGAAPNAPTTDVLRLARVITAAQPEVVVAVGGGSNIDAAKAALAYSVLGDRYPDLNEYFGIGQVRVMLEATGRALPLLVAVQLASGSAAHLTKYANVTDMTTHQKMLIVDEAVTPPAALYDYRLSASMSADFTMDGALDGIAHCLEVLYGAQGEALERARPVALLGIELIVTHLKAAVANPNDPRARGMIGLGTDLGGYAIMIGGTNGAHLNSFSLVDLLPHGRACALMNPYYTVFFAPAIGDKLRDVAAIYQRAGYLTRDIDGRDATASGLAVANAMVALSRDIGFPVTLREVPGYTPAHRERCLTAAKSPKLASKLQNMPVPLASEEVDAYMGSVLEAAETGDFTRVKVRG